VPARRRGNGSGSADAAAVFAAEGTELAEGVAALRGVASEFGELRGVLLAGLHARTVQERVPSRKALRLTSNPIPRLVVLDRPGGSRCFLTGSELPPPSSTPSSLGCAAFRLTPCGALLGRAKGDQTRCTGAVTSPCGISVGLAAPH